MKSRMILPALLAVGLFCLISTSSAKAGLFGRHARSRAVVARQWSRRVAVKQTPVRIPAVRRASACWPACVPSALRSTLAVSRLASPLVVPSPLVVRAGLWC